MILLGVLFVLTLTWDMQAKAPPSVAMLGLAWAGLGALAWCRGSSQRRWLLAGVVLEELLIAAAVCGPEPGVYWSDWRGGVAVAALALAGVLISQRPLPDAWLPLRGVWLRRFLAPLALLGLLQYGPWAWLIHYWWSTVRLPGAALALGLFVGGWLLALSSEMLAAGAWGLPRRASRPPAREVCS